MGFGLAVDLLNFSKAIEFERHNLSIYRKAETLELLTSLIVQSIRQTIKFESKQTPTMSDIGWYLGEIFSRYNPQNSHAFFKCFFTHLYANDHALDQNLVPDMIRLENTFYITPKLYSFEPEVLSAITKKDSPFLFDKIEREKTENFAWKMEHTWLCGLKSHIINYRGEDVLMLAQLPDNDKISVRQQLFRFYLLLFETFKKSPFTSDETVSKKIIHDYIVTMRNFLEVKPE